MTRLELVNNRLVSIELYDPAVHRPLVTLFAVDARVSTLSWRSWALWTLGYPEAAVADADQAVTDAREIGQAATLTGALRSAGLTHMFCGDYTAAIAQSDELVALSDEKGTLFRKALGMMNQGCASVLIGKASPSSNGRRASVARTRTHNVSRSLRQCDPVDRHAAIPEDPQTSNADQRWQDAASGRLRRHFDCSPDRLSLEQVRLHQQW